MEVPQLDYRPTVPAFLRRCAEAYGEKDFVVTPTARMSYAEAERASRRVAKQLLARGMAKGARVGYMYGNGPEWLILFFAISRAGGVAMPFSTIYRPAELRTALRLGDVDTLLIPSTLMGHDHLAYLEQAVPGLADAGAGPLRLPDVPHLRSVLVSGPCDRNWASPIDLSTGLGTDDPEISEALLDAVEQNLAPADPAVIICTSGTTAEPKGVIHSHGTWVRHGANMADCNDVPWDQRVMGGMPLFWIGGISHTVGPIMHRGSTFLCTEKFDPDAATDLMIAEQATDLYMQPGMADRLRAHLKSTGRDVASVPFFARAASATPVDPATVAKSLGMTETCAAYIASGPRGHVIEDEYYGAFGFPVQHMQYRIADLETGETVADGIEGEICVRGYSVMLGMCKKERHEVFDDDGWYHTGDKGYRRGPYLWFTGRAKDLIKSAGANVAPREVEVVLDAMPEIVLSVVVGLPDAERGEIVGAVIVPASGAAVDLPSVLGRAAEVLSPYKVPRRVLVVPETEVPYLGTGKPDRLALRDALVERGQVVSARG